MAEVVETKWVDKGKQVATSPASPATCKDAAVNVNYRPYPPPLAKYEEVAADRVLFIITLEKLHATLGTKFMVPTIGGKELDLHRLFVEVTSRGGVEKVTGERRWKEITAVFRFPSTATNASFVLRKYYLSLMHHYEQIYFFGAQGWISPPDETPVAVRKRKQNMVEPILQANEPFGLLPINYPVVGVIDGKFEHGYFVTVVVGAEELKGVLYHTTEYPAACLPQGLGAVNSGAVGVGRRRRRKRKLSTLDPTHPKPNRSGYNFFFAEQHASLKPFYPGRDREISKIIGDRWSKLTVAEKSVYQERGLKDKERYRSEMVVYREKQKTGQAINNAVQIRLQPPGFEGKQPDPIPDMKVAYLPLTPENEGSPSGSGTDNETLDDGAELGNSTEEETHAKATNPASFTEDGFELRRRNSGVIESMDEISGANKEANAKK